MNRRLFLSLLAAFILLTPAVIRGDGGTPSGDAILERVDDNLVSDTRIVTSMMVIHDRRGTRTVTAKTWARGEREAFTEYLSPTREKGTKMLKLEDRLWIYSPSTDRTILISGHLLRQSLMGSDLSYEDMMEDPRLSERYDAEVTGTERVNDHACWVVSLRATRPDVAYQSRKIWVDRERYVPLREEMYAKSGRLLKKADLDGWEQLGVHWLPRRTVYRDMLKTGDGTEFLIESIEFDAVIPDHVFSKASLRR